MPDFNLEEYIRESLKKGVSSETVKEKLKPYGYGSDVVDKYIDSQQNMAPKKKVSRGIIFIAILILVLASVVFVLMTKQDTYVCVNRVDNYTSPVVKDYSLDYSTIDECDDLAFNRDICYRDVTAATARTLDEINLSCSRIKNEQLKDDCFAKSCKQLINLTEKIACYNYCGEGCYGSAGMDLVSENMELGLGFCDKYCDEIPCDNPGDEHIKALCYLDTARAISKEDSDLAIKICEKLEEQGHSLLGVGFHCRSIVSFYTAMSDYQKALEYCDFSGKSSWESDSDMGECYGLVSAALYIQNAPEREHICDKIEDKEPREYCYYNTARYLSLKQCNVSPSPANICDQISTQLYQGMYHDTCVSVVAIGCDCHKI